MRNAETELDGPTKYFGKRRDWLWRFVAVGFVGPNGGSPSPMRLWSPPRCIYPPMCSPCSRCHIKQYSVQECWPKMSS